MKSPSNHSALDAFIRETLKASDDMLQPFDWSEVEVLLKHDQRSIPVEINKKTVLLMAASVGALILLFGIFKVVSHYSSLPADTSTPVDSTVNTFTLADTLGGSIPISVAIKGDSSLTDTLTTLQNTRAVDSSLVKKAEEPSNLSALPLPKKEKKKKNYSEQNGTVADSANKTTPTSLPVITDTVSKPAVKESRIEIAPATDTITKKQSTEKNTSKKKKSKGKNTSQQPPEQQTAPPVAQPDSLK